jgi:hypothetical protein
MNKFMLSLFAVLLLNGCVDSTVECNESGTNGVLNNQLCDKGLLHPVLVRCYVEKVDLPKIISPSFDTKAEAVLKPDDPRFSKNRILYKYLVSGSFDNVYPDIKAGDYVTLMFATSNNGKFLGRRVIPQSDSLSELPNKTQP